MVAGTSSLRYFVLGLLSRQPMSGYDVKRFLDSLSWLIGNPSFGSLYPALHGLLEDGLVVVEVQPQPGKPDRKIYTITEAGRRGLDEWASRPAGGDATLRAFTMRLFLAGTLSEQSLREHLARRRVQVAEQRAALEKAASTESEATDVERHLALDYGLALANAELAWLDGVLSHLTGSNQQPVAVEPGNDGRSAWSSH
jgi:PadR family transcriptional regulator, regulatory protein AphA